MDRLRDEVYAGMAGNGVVGTAADEIWAKLQGFASFGFPEGHSVSFAYIVYMSAWLRYHYPAEFLAGLLNAQPMGFYSPNSLVQDAIRHGVVVLNPDVNISLYDCTVEPHASDQDDIVEYYGMHWQRGRGAIDDPPRAAVAVRMGLRYVRNLGDAEVTRIEVARQVRGEFSDAADLANRTGLPVDTLEGLAASGALETFGLGVREGMWAAGALAEIGPGKLPLVPGLDPPGLAPMGVQEAHQATLWATGVSARHPIEFVRERLNAAGCITVADALSRERNGVRAKVGGVVIHRQRPGTAGGVIFFNFEDETGLMNIVVLPDIWKKHKEVARRNPGLVIDGVLEFRDGVTNLVARSFTPIETDVLKSRDFR